MTLRIGTNIASLNAHRNLSKITELLQKSYRHLSSGQRIATAADDPAGLAISERLRAQIRSVTRAQLNANDGISLSQTAEGALNEISSMLVRMRELAIESANGSLTGADKDSLQSEFAALNDEITRIAESARFNNQSLLNGAGTYTFQVGAGTVGGVDTISLTLSDMRSAALGLTGLDIGSSGDTNAAIQQIDVAVDMVTEMRGDLGAFENRVTHAINYLGKAIENLSAAESRIRDVDVAMEMANVTKYSIIQQAAIAVLAQANQQPWAVLALMK